MSAGSSTSILFQTDGGHNAVHWAVIIESTPVTISQRNFPRKTERCHLLNILQTPDDLASSEVLTIIELGHAVPGGVLRAGRAALVV